MSLIKPTVFARQTNISKQAVFKAITNGNLPFQLVNNKKMIDTDDPGVINYRCNNSHQREVAKKPPSEIEAKKIAKSKARSEFVDDLPPNLSLTSGESSGNSQTIDGMTAFDLGLNKKYEDWKKVQLLNEKLRGRLLDRGMVYDYVFLYLDKINSNLERLAGAFLTDVGHKIIEAAGVDSGIREEWKSGVLEGIDNAKREVVKRLDEIAAKQNE